MGNTNWDKLISVGKTFEIKQSKYEICEGRTAITDSLSGFIIHEIGVRTIPQKGSTIENPFSSAEEAEHFLIHYLSRTDYKKD